MKKLLFILLLTIPFIGYGQGTTGYSITYDGHVSKTTDSGVTWTPQGHTGTWSDNQNISFVNSISTSTFNIPTPFSNRNLEKIVDILGRETKPQTNSPFIEIYDDGSTEKKLIIEK